MSEWQLTMWRALYAGVALTTMATLLLELALTRIFSVVLFYHFAFLAISVALFGLGVGAIASYAVDWRRIGWISTLNAPLTAIVLAGIVRQNVSIEVTAATAWKLAATYFAAALPFFAAGVVISLAISAGMERVHRLYFFDLAGAAAGCLLLVPLLNRLGGPNTALAAAALYGAAGAVWFGAAGNRKGLWGALATTGAVAACIAWNQQAHAIDVRYAKGMRIEHELF